MVDDAVIVDVVLVAVDVTSNTSPYNGTSDASSPVRVLDKLMTKVRSLMPSCTLS